MTTDADLLQVLEDVEYVYMPYADHNVQKLADLGYVRRESGMEEYAELTDAGRERLAELRK